MVRLWRFEVGRDAAEREKEICRQFAGDRYYGPRLLFGADNGEIFTHDVLGLDGGDQEHGHLDVHADANLNSRQLKLFDF